ncbi:MAG: ureidoglycolate lyase, partial [Geminicoccaceae bacterium]
MAQIVEIRLEPLTAESFAPFGQLLAERDTPPVFQASHLRSWRMNFEVDGAAQLLVVRYVHEPFACHLLERHLSVTQAFGPLGEHPSVMVAAPPTDLDDLDHVPRPDEVRAFYVRGSRGLMLWRGTWHALTRFPVRSEG